MDDFDILDEAQFRAELREIYVEEGVEGCIKAMYEMLLGAQMLTEIILEEMDKQ